MRSVIVVIIGLMMWSCTGHEPSDEEKFSALTGRWQLVKKKVGTGSAGSWQPVDNGLVYQLNSDSTFVLSENPVCTSGSWYFTDNLLHLDFECSAYDERTYYYSLSGLYLTLSPAKVLCVEGCEFKYRKL